MTENENAVKWTDTPEYQLLDALREDAGLAQVEDLKVRHKPISEEAVTLAAQKQEFPLETWNKALQYVTSDDTISAESTEDAQQKMTEELKTITTQKLGRGLFRKANKPIKTEKVNEETPSAESAEGETPKTPSFLSKAKETIVHWFHIATKPENAKVSGVILAGIVVIAVIIACVSGGKSTAGLTPSLKTAAAERTTLTVGVNDAYIPPFLYIDYNGNYTGTDYTLMKDVCKAYGWELVVKPIDWTNRENALTTGQVDCLWSGFNSYGREDHYEWSKTYLDTSDVIVVKKGSSIKDLEGLDGKRVAAISGSSAYTNLEGIGLGLTRLGCSSAAQCLELLNKGDVDAIAITKGEASLMSGVKVLDDYLDYQTYAVACNEGDTVLPALLNAVFDAQNK